MERPAERHVDLRRAALAARGHEPAVVEDLAGVQLPRAEQGGVRLLHAADQGMKLRDRMGSLLEDDVLGRSEHPMREIPGVELRERHREADPHVLDAADAARPHPVQEAREGRMVEVVVVDPKGDPARRGQLRQLAGVAARKGEGLLHERADPRLQELTGHPHVEVRRSEHVRDLDVQGGQLLDRGHRRGDAPALRQGARPFQVRIAHRGDLQAGDAGHGLDVEGSHVPRPDDRGTDLRHRGK
jgi:hypothetical protein